MRQTRPNDRENGMALHGHHLGEGKTGVMVRRHRSISHWLKHLSN